MTGNRSEAEEIVMYQAGAPLHRVYNARRVYCCRYNHDYRGGVVTEIKKIEGVSREREAAKERKERVA